MKTVMNIVGWLMIFIYALGTIMYWNSVYPGGIGLFGSILTLPMAMVLAFIFSMFSGLLSALINIVWVVTAVWLAGKE